MAVMPRPSGTPRNVPPATGSPEAPVIPGERCDRCGAAPRHRVAIPYARKGTLLRGELLLCSHHYEVHAPALAAAGYRVSRERP